MNIMLMGCSWGVPNYFGPPGDHHSVHTEFLLKELGHTVYNCSLNGGSNFMTHQRAYDFVNGDDIRHPASGDWPLMPGIKDCKIDLVIWFHTDPGRDIGLIDPKNKSILTQLEEVCAILYKNYASLFKQLNCKVAVIGACSDVHPTISQYIQMDYLLPSWQHVLLNVSTKFFRIETGLAVPSEEDIQLTENALKVYEAMDKDRILFPDGGHPGGIAHRALVETLRAANLGI